MIARLPGTSMGEKYNSPAFCMKLLRLNAGLSRQQLSATPPISIVALSIFYGVSFD